MLPVYCDHFRLTREPFSITPDPSFLYLSESHEEALAQLVYGIKSRRGFVVLTGEVGTGKTTLIHRLLEELNDNTKTALIFNMIVSPKELLRYVCEKFGLVSDQESERDTHDYLSLLERFLLDAYRKGSNVALIIDEAQNLPTEVLENVRLLSNFETTRDKLLQILLVGQPELSSRLDASNLRQVKQRVALRHHLNPLNLSECRSYIAKRLEIAGGDISRLTPEAVSAVYSYSGGIPRLINILCDNGLLTAYALRKNSVETAMIIEIARDLQLPATGHLVKESIVAGLRGVTASQPAKMKPERAAQSIVDRLVAGPSLDQTAVKAGNGTKNAIQPIAEIPSAVTLERKSASQTVASVESNSDTVPARFFDSMTRALIDAMGPMAPFVVNDQVRAMEESVKAFPKRRLVQLVEETGREISCELLKAAYQRAMFEAIRAIQNPTERP
jgi:general secretion pathway protein A